MKRGIIIQARMGSSRLKGKILLPLGGIPVLQHVVSNCLRANTDAVIVATTTGDQDDVIDEFCTRMGYNCYRGDEDNVLQRYYFCATEFGLDEIIRVTSDCPLVCPYIIDAMIDLFESSAMDYVRVDTSFFPRGYDAEIFSFKNLERSFLEATKESEKEHVTPYMRTRCDFKRTTLTNPVSYGHYRLTLDTQEDYELLKKIFASVEVKSFENVMTYLNSHPEVVAINKDVKQKMEF